MYIKEAIKFIYTDTDDINQEVIFDSDEYNDAVRTEYMPVISQTTQKNITYRYLPTKLRQFKISLSFRIKNRATYDNLSNLIGQSVDIYPYYGDLGSVLNLQEINYTELDYFDKNSFTGIIDPSIDIPSYASLLKRGGTVNLVFNGFYRKVPEGIKDIILSLRDVSLLSYHSSYAITSIIRGSSPDDQYTARLISSGSNEIETGNMITIAGMTTSGYNGNWWTLARKSSTTFTFEVPNSLTTPATVGSGTVVKFSQNALFQSEIRIIIRDISGGNYPVDVYLRNFTNRDKPGQLSIANFTNWRTNILGASRKFYLHTPYNTTNAETATDGIATPTYFTVNTDFDYTESEGTDVWHLFMSGTITPTQYADWITALDLIGVP